MNVVPILFNDWSLFSSLPLFVSLVPGVITWNLVVEECLGETVLLAKLKKSCQVSSWWLFVDNSFRVFSIKVDSLPIF